MQPTAARLGPHRSSQSVTGSVLRHGDEADHLRSADVITRIVDHVPEP